MVAFENPRSETNKEVLADVFTIITLSTFLSDRWSKWSYIGVCFHEHLRVLFSLDGDICPVSNTFMVITLILSSFNFPVVDYELTVLALRSSQTGSRERTEDEATKSSFWTHQRYNPQGHELSARPSFHGQKANKIKHGTRLPLNMRKRGTSPQ